MSTAKSPNTDLHAVEASERASNVERPVIEWRALVSQIRSGDDTGMQQLYKLLNRGIRYYLCRHLGPQELEDKVQDTLLIVVHAIKRGHLGEPEHIMGFVRTVVRRQVAAYTKQTVHCRRTHADLEVDITAADRKWNPEQEAIIRKKAELMKSALSSLSQTDRNILVRFYLHEQPREQIYREMDLTEAQFRLLKSRAKAKLLEIGRKGVAPALP